MHENEIKRFKWLNLHDKGLTYQNIKYRQVNSNKLLSGARSPSCRPGSVQYITCRKYKTTNWSLRQGDEEVNKRIKEKNIYLNKFVQYFGLKRSPKTHLFKNVLQSRDLWKRRLSGFSFTFGPTKTEVFEYDDVVHQNTSFNYVIIS